jgi:hypothetical protein
MNPAPKTATRTIALSPISLSAVGLHSNFLNFLNFRGTRNQLTD